MIAQAISPSRRGTIENIEQGSPSPNQPDKTRRSLRNVALKVELTSIPSRATIPRKWQALPGGISAVSSACRRYSDSAMTDEWRIRI